MAVGWTDAERAEVEQGLLTHPIESGRCAALARLIAQVAIAGGREVSGHQVRPVAGRYVVPKHPNPPQWASHTFAGTEAHAVDVLTSSTGTLRDRYLAQHWEHPEYLALVDVDLEEVDRGIQHL